MFLDLPQGLTGKSQEELSLLQVLLRHRALSASSVSSHSDIQCSCGSSGDYANHMREAFAVAGIGLFTLADPDDTDLMDGGPVWSTAAGEVTIREDGIHLDETNVGSGRYARELSLALMAASFVDQRDIIEGDCEDE